MAQLVELKEFIYLYNLIDDMKKVREKNNELTKTLVSYPDKLLINPIKMIERKKNKEITEKYKLELIETEKKLKEEFYNEIHKYDVSYIKSALKKYGEMLAETSTHGSIKSTIAMVELNNPIDKQGINEQVRSPKISRVVLEMIDSAKKALKFANDALKSGNQHDYIINLAKYEWHKNDLEADTELNWYHLGILMEYENELGFTSEKSTLRKSL